MEFGSLALSKSKFGLPPRAETKNIHTLGIITKQDDFSIFNKLSEIRKSSKFNTILSKSKQNKISLDSFSNSVIIF